MLVGGVAPRNCARDEGGPLGAGLQEQASNHLKLLWLSVRVVSVEGKGRATTLSGEVQGDERKRTTDEVSKRIRRLSELGAY